MHSDYALRLDITGLAQLLSCPAHMRKVNCYQAKFIKIVMGDTIKKLSITKSYSDGDDFNFTKIVNAHYGLNLEYGKADGGTWLGDHLRKGISSALGFTPLVGPFLSAGFDLGRTAIADPDSFMRELSLWIPGIKLIEEMMLKEDLEASSKEIRNLVDERWLDVKPLSPPIPSGGMERIPQVIIKASELLSANGEDEEMPLPVVKATSYLEDALIALNESGTNPTKYEKGDPEDVGEVVAIIPEKEDLEGGCENNSEEVQVIESNSCENKSEEVQA
jgi:hypothetical protein